MIQPSHLDHNPEAQPGYQGTLFDGDSSDTPKAAQPVVELGHKAAVAAGKHYDPAFDPAEANIPSGDQTKSMRTGVAAARHALEQAAGSSSGDEHESKKDTPPAKIAFGKCVKPEMYDIFGEYDLGDLTEEEKDWMTADKLTATIFDPPTDAKLVVNQHGSRVALNAYEYGLLARHPRALARQVGATVLGDHDIDEERLAASERGTEHALTAKLEAMKQHAEKMAGRREMVGKLQREAKKPGYAHKTQEEMYEWLSAAWVEFKGILDVRHVQKNWSDEKRKKAEAALIFHLTQGGQRDRIAHWQSMLDLATKNLRARGAIFKDRINQVEDLVVA